MRLRRRRPWFRCDCGFVIWWILDFVEVACECEAVRYYTHLSPTIQYLSYQRLRLHILSVVIPLSARGEAGRSGRYLFLLK